MLLTTEAPVVRVPVTALGRGAVEEAAEVEFVDEVAFAEDVPFVFRAPSAARLMLVIVPLTGEVESPDW